VLVSVISTKFDEEASRFIPMALKAQPELRERNVINAISGKCRTYTGIHPEPAASMDAAIVQAAHYTGLALPVAGSKLSVTTSPPG
jgi:hypothetical protein